MGSQGGCLKLPPGFRFHPTDEELVVQYLRRRVFSFPLPASVVSDIDMCKYDPWDLPGECLGSSSLACLEFGFVGREEKS